MKIGLMTGIVRKGRITTFTSTETGVQGSSRPTTHSIAPPQPVQPVVYDVPTFLHKPKPVSTPDIKPNRQSFASILKETERLINSL